MALYNPVETCVTVYQGTTDVEAGQACTDEFGEYSVADLTAGTYQVLFDAVSDDFARQWWNSTSRRADADPIVLASSAEEVADATLVPGGTLAGVVTDEQSNPVVWRDGARLHERGLVLQRSAVTDGTGAYTLTGLDDEDYHIEVVPGSSRLDLLGEWYNDKADYTNATAVPVPNGANATANVALDKGATISGVVTGNNGPVAGIAVSRLCRHRGQILTVWTGPQGEYTATALPPGDFKVAFWPNYYGGKEYANQWWNNKGSFESADIISLGKKEKRTGVNATLALLVPQQPPGGGGGTNPPPVQSPAPVTPPPAAPAPLTAPTKVKVRSQEGQGARDVAVGDRRTGLPGEALTREGQAGSLEAGLQAGFHLGQTQEGQVRRGGQSPGQRGDESGNHRTIQGEVDDPQQPARHHHDGAHRRDVDHRTRGRVSTLNDPRSRSRRVCPRHQGEGHVHRRLREGDGIAERGESPHAHHQEGEEARQDGPDPSHVRRALRPETRQVRAGYTVPHTQGRDLPSGQALRGLSRAGEEDHRTDGRVPDQDLAR